MNQQIKQMLDDYSQEYSQLFKDASIETLSEIPIETINNFAKRFTSAMQLLGMDSPSQLQVKENPRRAIETRLGVIAFFDFCYKKVTQKLQYL